jgi:hypothetical protein
MSDALHELAVLRGHRIPKRKKDAPLNSSNKCGNCQHILRYHGRTNFICVKQDKRFNNHGSVNMVKKSRPACPYFVFTDVKP